MTAWDSIILKMQETKENELLALVKYIMRNPAKLLIMNSRVTIFH